MICMEGETVKKGWDFSSSHHTIEKFFILPLLSLSLLFLPQKTKVKVKVEAKAKAKANANANAEGRHAA